MIRDGQYADPIARRKRGQTRKTACDLLLIGQLRYMTAKNCRVVRQIPAPIPCYDSGQTQHK